MSVLLALAIIVAIIAVACAVKAVRVTAAKPHAGATTHVVDIINPDCMEAVVMVLAYTKSALKEERLNGRRSRARAWHINNCASKESARKARKDAMGPVAAANRRAVAAAECRKALARAHKAPAATYAQLGACGIKAAKRAALGIKVATHRRVVPIVHTHVCTPAVVRTIKRVPTIKAANAAPRGKELGAAARSVHGSLVARIQASKATLNSMYEILPLARQVVGLSNKANRKVDMYTWLSDEGHVGIRSTKSSCARRDKAQELVCKAILAEEAFKAEYGVSAHEVYNTIRAAKAAKARAVELLISHKAEQHRLFLERQERRAAKAALKTSKVITATSPAVTEVADWEQYVPSNNCNKAIAFGILHATSATVAQKASAIAAINGASQEQHVVCKCTADAAYGVAA